MVTEVLAVSIMAFVGITAVFSVGMRGWALLPLGFLVGVSLIILSGFFQLLIDIPTTPVIPLTILSLLTAAYWIYFLYRGYKAKRRFDIRPIIKIIAIAAGISLLVALTYKLVEPFTFIRHVDSMEYLALGGMFESGTFNEGVSLYQLQKRMLVVPFMHSAANLGGNLFFYTITPLIALSTLGLMVWVWSKGLGRIVKDKVVLTTVLILGTLLLLANHMFLVHSTYVNSHLFFGTMLVMLVGSLWLMTKKTDIPIRVLVFLQIISIPILILARPEASMIVMLALIPVIVSTAFSFKHKSLLLVSYAVPVIAWQGYLTYLYFLSSGSLKEISFSVYGLIGLGVGALLLIPIMKTRLFQWLASHIPTTAEVLLWLGVIVFYLRDPELLNRSVVATVKNVVSVSWGPTWLIIAALLILLLIFVKFGEQRLLRYSVTTFLPLVFLLVYLREGPYRVGITDSLDRMWMQIIPLVVLYIIVAIVCGKWRFGGGKKRIKSVRRKAST